MRITDDEPKKITCVKIKDDDTFKINHSFVHSYQYPPSYGEKNSQDSIQTFSNNRLTRENATSNQLKNVENTDLNSYILQNNNPIIDSGNWYAVKLSDGRTVYKINSTNGQYFSLSTNNHLTSDPSQAYSGPINFVDSTVTITNGATVSGSNFLLIKTAPLTIQPLQSILVERSRFKYIQSKCYDEWWQFNQQHFYFQPCYHERFLHFG